MPDITPIRDRKNAHLSICRTQPVEFRSKRTGFEHVEMVHQAIPTCSPTEVDTSVRFLGRTLALPFLIGAMTGGTAEAREVNRSLATVAAEKNIGLALGSQRAMFEDPSLIDTYRVRDVAPDILLLGNIGLAQAMAMEPDQIAALMNAVGADGMCLHLNAAMEMSQQEGDDPTGNAHSVIRRLRKALGERLIVKETGCGISRETGRELARLGVRTVDVAGAGGTSWVRVENVRRGGAPAGPEELEEWGIPTAASLLEVRGLKFRVIASGGVRTGLELAKAIALGADMGSAALPLLRALGQHGGAGPGRWVDSLAKELRSVMVLAGCTNVKDLQRTPVVVSGPLLAWMEQRGLERPEGD